MCSWLTRRVEPTGSVSVCSMIGDFYEGTAGAAAFLLKVAGAGAVPAATYLDRLGVGAAKRSARLAADEIRAGRDWGGLFLGPLSVLLALCESHQDRSADDLGACVSDLAQSLAGRLRRRRFRLEPGDLDLLGGHAGKLAAFSRLAIAPGMDVRERQVFLDQIPPAPQTRRLLASLPPDGPGIAHGAAGMAVACMDACLASGDKEYESLAAALLERCLVGGQAALPMTWCRGTVGIAAAAIYARDSFSPAHRAAADHVLRVRLPRTSLAGEMRPIGTCLCHGTAGLHRLRSRLHAGLDSDQFGSPTLDFGSELGLFTGTTDAWLESADTGLWPLLGPLAAPHRDPAGHS